MPEPTATRHTTPVDTGWLTEVLLRLREIADLPQTPAAAWDAQNFARAALAEYDRAHPERQGRALEEVA
jgi:hypothetical protein